MSAISRRIQRGLGWFRGVRWHRLSAVTARLGECPRWDVDGGAVYWVDIPAGRLHCTRVPGTARRPADGTMTWAVGSEIAALAMRANGELWAWVDGTFGRFDPINERFSPARVIEGIDVATHRANDGAWAPDGSLWVTTMARDGRSRTGSLWRLAEVGQTAVLSAGFAIGNGPAFDAVAGLVYVVDSVERRILRGPIGEQGVARGTDSKFTVFVETGARDGHPDGLAVDPHGHLWVAHYGNATLSIWSRNGERLGIVPTPFPCPTAIALRPSASGTRLELAVTSAAMDGVAGGLWMCTLPCVPPRD